MEVKKPKFTGKFEHVSVEDNRSVLKYLKEIKESVEKGRIVLAGSSDMCELILNGMMEMDLKIKNEKKEKKIDLKIEWRDPYPLSDKDNSLKISASES